MLAMISCGLAMNKTDKKRISCGLSCGLAMNKTDKKRISCGLSCGLAMKKQPKKGITYGTSYGLAVVYPVISFYTWYEKTSITINRFVHLTGTCTRKPFSTMAG
jgi:hypothetical protein